MSPLRFYMSAWFLATMALLSMLLSAKICLVSVLRTSRTSPKAPVRSAPTVQSRPVAIYGRRPPLLVFSTASSSASGACPASLLVPSVLLAGLSSSAESTRRMFSAMVLAAASPTSRREIARCVVIGTRPRRDALAGRNACAGRETPEGILLNMPATRLLSREASALLLWGDRDFSQLAWPPAAVERPIRLRWTTV